MDYPKNLALYKQGTFFGFFLMIDDIGSYV